jgi:hypothetical protein
MARKLGRLIITVFLILAVALTLNAYDLPTGIGEKLLQRTTKSARTTSEHTTRERTTTSRRSSSSSSTNSSSSGPCPAGVVCSSSSSSSSVSSSSSSSLTLAFRTIPSSSLTFRTMPSSSTPGPGCSYLGILPGTVRNHTISTTIITVLGSRTNQTNSTVVETTCAIPGFPLEGIIIGTVVGLLFVIMSRSKSRRVITN